MDCAAAPLHPQRSLGARLLPQQLQEIVTVFDAVS
jgi:hypothetical protein